MALSQVKVEGAYPGSQNVTVPPSGTYGIYDLLGDSDLSHLLGEELPFNLTPWYSSSPTTEGIREGWFYSVLGGGKDKRLKSVIDRVPLSFDNTLERRMRGDFAVPTLFNGNFDAVFETPPSIVPPDSPSSAFRNFDLMAGSTAIPAWSFHNGAEPGSTWDLVDWKAITSLSDYRTQIGYDPNQPNYALKLTGGQSITHNRFVVPDWGMLRFNLHTPNLNGGQLQVTLQTNDGSTAGVSSTIFLQPAIPNALEYLGNTRKVGFGTQSFETFTLDIPDNLRGKTATLTFQLNGSDKIYLDEIFFKSKDLMLGLPTLNQQQPRPVLSTHADNFLVEKPQYTLSYNQDKKGPSWVSWYLDKTWLGNVPRPNEDDAQLVPDYPYRDIDYAWMPDPTLPSGLATTIPTDYAADPNYDRGHLSPVEQRNRSTKDVLATFLTTNVLLQYFSVNGSGGA